MKLALNSLPRHTTEPCCVNRFLAKAKVTLKTLWREVMGAEGLTKLSSPLSKAASMKTKRDTEAGVLNLTWLCSVQFKCV